MQLPSAEGRSIAMQQRECQVGLRVLSPVVFSHGFFVCGTYRGTVANLSVLVFLQSLNLCKNSSLYLELPTAVRRRPPSIIRTNPVLVGRKYCDLSVYRIVPSSAFFPLSSDVALYKWVSITMFDG